MISARGLDDTLIGRPVIFSAIPTYLPVRTAPHGSPAVGRSVLCAQAVAGSLAVSCGVTAGVGAQTGARMQWCRSVCWVHVACCAVGVAGTRRAAVGYARGRDGVDHLQGQLVVACQCIPANHARHVPARP